MLPLSALAGRRVTVSYLPATVDDHRTVNAFGGLDSVPVYLVRLRPQVKVDGRTVAVGEGTPADGGRASGGGRGRRPLRQRAGGADAARRQLSGGVGGTAALDCRVPIPAATSPTARPWRRGCCRSSRATTAGAATMPKRSWPASPAVTVAAAAAVGGLRHRRGAAGGGLRRPAGADLGGGHRRRRPARRRAARPLGKRRRGVTGLDAAGRPRGLRRSSTRVFEDELLVESVSADKGLGVARQAGTEVVTVDAGNAGGILPRTVATAGGDRRRRAVDRPRLHRRRAARSGRTQRLAGVGVAGGGPGERRRRLLPRRRPRRRRHHRAARTRGSSTSWPMRWPRPTAVSPNTDPLAGVEITKVAETDGQEAEVGEELPLRLAVRVRDESGRPVQGAEVVFTSWSGGGRLLTENGQESDVLAVATDRRGFAEVRFRLGQHTADDPIYVERDPGDRSATQALIHLDRGHRPGPLGSAHPRPAFHRRRLPRPPERLYRVGTTCDRVRGYGLDLVRHHGNPRRRPFRQSGVERRRAVPGRRAAAPGRELQQPRGNGRERQGLRSRSRRRRTGRLPDRVSRGWASADWTASPALTTEPGGGRGGDPRRQLGARPTRSSPTARRSPGRLCVSRYSVIYQQLGTGECLPFILSDRAANTRQSVAGGRGPRRPGSLRALSPLDSRVGAPISSSFKETMARSYYKFLDTGQFTPVVPGGSRLPRRQRRLGYARRIRRRGFVEHHPAQRAGPGRQSLLGGAARLCELAGGLYRPDPSGLARPDRCTATFTHPDFPGSNPALRSARVLGGAAGDHRRHPLAAGARRRRPDPGRGHRRLRDPASGIRAPGRPRSICSRTANGWRWGRGAAAKEPGCNRIQRGFEFDLDKSYAARLTLNRGRPFTRELSSVVESEPVPMPLFQAILRDVVTAEPGVAGGGSAQPALLPAGRHLQLRAHPGGDGPAGVPPHRRPGNRRHPRSRSGAHPDRRRDAGRRRLQPPAHPVGDRAGRRRADPRRLAVDAAGGVVGRRPRRRAHRDGAFAVHRARLAAGGARAGQGRGPVGRPPGGGARGLHRPRSRPGAVVPADLCQPRRRPGRRPRRRLEPQLGDAGRRHPLRRGGGGGRRGLGDALRRRRRGRPAAAEGLPRLVDRRRRERRLRLLHQERYPLPLRRRVRVRVLPFVDRGPVRQPNHRHVRPGRRTAAAGGGA